MKKLSNRDWAIILVVAICFAAVGFGIAGLFQEEKVINIENPVNIKLKKSNDSLEACVTLRDSLLKESAKRQALCDSALINNNRQFKKDYEKIKNFTPEFRAHYVDSVLRGAGIRK